MSPWGEEDDRPRAKTIYAEGVPEPSAIAQVFAVDDRADLWQDLMRPPEEWIAEAERAEVRRWKAVEKRRREAEKASYGTGSPYVGPLIPSHPMPSPSAWTPCRTPCPPSALPCRTCYPVGGGGGGGGGGVVTVLSHAWVRG